MLGKNEGAPLVVRQRSARLRTAVGIATALLGLFALYVSYELGRYDAGYDRQAAAQQRTELQVQIEHLNRDNREMRTKLAELDTIRVAQPASYTVHLSLVRSGRPDSEAQGVLQLSLDGSYAGSPKTLDLAALTGGKLREMRYNFRYLQNFEQDLTLPLAFKPERLAVEVQSTRHDLAPLSQTFLWRVEAAP
jgi:hypothetical protein